MHDGDKAKIAKLEPFIPPQRFRLVPFDKIELPTDRPYLVDGIIPREGLVVVWGPPKCGKSFWVLDIIMHVALAREYRSRRVVHGPVVYIACEGERGLAARVHAFRERHMAEDSEAPPFFLMTTRLDLVHEVEDLIAQIKAQFDGGTCAAVVIDTLNRSLSGSESSDEDMSAYVKSLDAIREEFHCAVIVVHHCGIDDKRPRGHTSLAGAADAQIAIKKDDAGVVNARVEFMKDGEAGAEINSTLCVVELGENKDRQPITSCAIEPTDSAGRSRRRAPKVQGQAKTSVDGLRKALDEHGKPAPANCHVPKDARVVEVDLWRRYVYASTVSESDKPGSRQKAFARSVTKLQELGLVRVWGSEPHQIAWLTQ